MKKFCFCKFSSSIKSEKFLSLVNNNNSKCFLIWSHYLALAGSSHQRCSVKEGVLRNFTKFTGKNLCQRLFLKKFAGNACNFTKKRLWHRCFPVNFSKFLRTPFSQDTSGQLLLTCAQCVNVSANGSQEPNT